MPFCCAHPVSKELSPTSGTTFHCVDMTRSDPDVISLEKTSVVNLRWQRPVLDGGGLAVELGNARHWRRAASGTRHPALRGSAEERRLAGSWTQPTGW